MNIAIVSVWKFIARVGSVFLSLLLIPFYLKTLGPDAFGVLGFYNTLLVIVSFLDFGYSGVISQEAAKTNIFLDREGTKTLGNLVRTVEIAAIIILLTFPSIGYLVTIVYFKKLIILNEFKQEGTELWVGILFIAATAKLPMALYTGLLVGLNRQLVACNINFLCNIMRGGLTFFVVSKINSSLTGFFLSQLVCNLVEMFALMFTVWRCLPERFYRSSFNINFLIQNKKFAAGILLISLTAAMVTQLDRVFLLTSVSIKDFGYFTVSATIASGILNVVYPFTSTLAPLFTRYRFEEVEKIWGIYSRSTSVIILLVTPFIVTAYLNSSGMLILYLGESIHVNSINPIFKTLLIGTLPMTFSPLASVLLISYEKMKIISFSNVAYFLAYGLVLIWFNAKVDLINILKYWACFNFAYLAVLSLSAYATLRNSFSGYLCWFLTTLLIPVLWTAMCGIVVHYILQWFVLPDVMKYFIEYTIILIMCIAPIWKSFRGVGKGLN